MLDILARDFKVDWWDPEYSIEEKRRTLKGNWRVHKILGTKAAVETALRAIYPKAAVQEWFEYGGEPYRYQVKGETATIGGSGCGPSCAAMLIETPDGPDLHPGGRL